MFTTNLPMEIPSEYADAELVGYVCYVENYIEIGYDVKNVGDTNNIYDWTSSRGQLPMFRIYEINGTCDGEFAIRLYCIANQTEYIMTLAEAVD